MADGFEAMVEAGQAFFADLARNNRKDWFEPRKDHHRDAIRKPGEFFAELLAEDLSRLTGRPHTGKVFRIHRDVRFSKDKSPYKPYQHTLWSQAGADGLTPAWFFSLEPDGLHAGMGVVGLQGETLKRYRAFVDRRGEALEAALGAAEGWALADFGAPLKRVPKPYDPEHPQGELLKRKSFVVMADLPGDWRETGLLKAYLATVQRAMPVWRVFDGTG